MDWPVDPAVDRVRHWCREVLPGAGDLADPAGAAAAFARVVDDGVLAAVPLPAEGRTAGRWAVLAAFGAADLTLTRLVEGHLDAVAILAELDGRPPRAGERWGVWAAEPAALLPLRAEPAPPGEGGGWRLHGTKAWCSGSSACTRALVTAQAADGRRLFTVDLSDPGVRVVPDSWPAVGMAGTDSGPVVLAGVPATAVGGVGSYVERPGFAAGGAGVAACWYGGAVGVAQALLDAARTREVGPHALAHLGAVDAALTATRAVLLAAAAEVDRVADGGRLRAARVRAAAEVCSGEVVDRVGRALGAAPLCADRRHARRVADLTVYVRQSHAERDLAAAGTVLAAGTDPRW